MFGFFSINSYESLTLDRWRNYIRFFVGRELFDRHTFWNFYGIIDESELAEAIMEQAPIAELCSIRYFVTHHEYDEKGLEGAWDLYHESDSLESKFYVYENKAAVPRAYLVNNYLLTSKENETLQVIGENISRLSYSVVLENGSPSFPSKAESREYAGEASIAEYGVNEVTLETNSKGPALVVLTDGYYPGWNAYVDGVRRPVWRANSLFRAVETPPGSHTVVFRFQPASLRWGLTISCLTVLLIAAGLLFERWYLSRRMIRSS
jgi:hypothetical protein